MVYSVTARPTTKITAHLFQPIRFSKAIAAASSEMEIFVKTFHAIM